jgi:hypothetical protein
MQPPRFPDFIGWTCPLACDENAPTETRAPSAPTALGATGDEPDLAAGDITTQSIALPVNQSVSTVAPNPAFRVNQTGSGPNGIFQISNTGNTQPALQGLTNGAGPAIQAFNIGAGTAGRFLITNASNSSDALQASTPGTGHAGSFEITNGSNNHDAIIAKTNGQGSAVHGISTLDGEGVFPAAGLFEATGAGNGVVAKAVGAPDYSPLRILWPAQASMRSRPVAVIFPQSDAPVCSSATSAWRVIST